MSEKCNVCGLVRCAQERNAKARCLAEQRAACRELVEFLPLKEEPPLFLRGKLQRIIDATRKVEEWDA